MKKETFDAQLARLNRKYKGVFDIETAKLLAKETRDLPCGSFESLIDFSIGEHPNPDWPPKLSHFREYAENERARLRDEERRSGWKRAMKVDEPRCKGELTYGGYDNVLDFLAAQTAMPENKKKVVK